MIFTLTKPCVLLALAASSLAPIAFSQDGGACNEMGRTPTLEAGYFNEMVTTCTSVSIDITLKGVFTGAVSTPSECKVGYTHRHQNIYKCDGNLPNVNCDWNGWMATITNASDGGCPQLPDFDALDFTSLEGILDIPMAVLRVFLCTSPKKDVQEDPSAKLADCAGSAQSAPTHFDGEAFLPVGSVRAEWWSSIFVASSQGSTGNYNPFHTFVDEGQADSGDCLTGPLGVVEVAQRGFEGARVLGSVAIEHWDAGAVAPSHLHSESISGTILPDGRFDCTRSTEATSQGDPVQSVHRTTFDGSKLRDHSALGESGNIYTLAGETPRRLHNVYLNEVSFLYRWVYDPYELPLEDTGIVFVETLAQSGNKLLSRYFPLSAGGQFCGTQYEVVERAGIILPIRRTEYGLNGGVWMEFEYSNFMEVRAGDWRPRNTVSTQYLDGNASGRKIVVRTTIQRATEYSPILDSPVPSGFADELNWLVWQPI